MAAHRTSIAQGLYAPYSREFTVEMGKERTPLLPALVLLFLAPVATTIAACLPYTLPWHAGDGLTLTLTTAFFLSMLFPGCVVAASFSTFLRTRLYSPAQVLGIFLPGCVLLPLLHQLANAFNWFPFPFASLVFGAPAFLLQVAAAVYFVDEDVRRKQRTELKSVVMVLVFTSVVYTAWMLYRLLFVALSGVAQALSILCLPLLRFGCLYTMERIVHGKVDTSGSMIVPVSFGIEMYNALFNASLFTSVATPFNAALIIVTDMAGTLFYFGIMLDVWKKLYHCCCCCCCSKKKRGSEVLPEMEAAEDATMVKRVSDASLAVVSIDGDEDAVEVECSNDSVSHRFVALGGTFQRWRTAARFGSDDVFSSYEARQFRWKLRISGFLLVEEFVELQVPLLMMLLTTFMKYGWTNDAFPTFKSMTDQRYVLSMQYLAISLLAEAVLFTITSLVLWKRFHIHVIDHLFFLAKKYWPLVLPQLALIVMFTLSLLTAYNGVDFTFKFAWLPE